MRRLVPVRDVARGLAQNYLNVRLTKLGTRGLLRILAFHGVADQEHFKLLLSAIVGQYRPVSATDILAAVRGDNLLPPYAVWVTFDDGLSSTLEAGQSMADLGISATAFVCPATIETGGRLWFQTVDAAEAAGVRDPRAPSRSELKTMPDARRRRYVADLETVLATVDLPAAEPVALARLHEWCAQGHSIGNHTWDHPCLDTCSEAEQTRQIVQAHEWLRQRGLATRIFAYPNGNTTDHAEGVLRGLGYEAAVLFDHRLTRLPRDPLRMSRLRIDSDASSRRAFSILSGSHSSAFHLGTRLTMRRSWHGRP